LNDQIPQLYYLTCSTLNDRKVRDKASALWLFFAHYNNIGFLAFLQEKEGGIGRLGEILSSIENIKVLKPAYRIQYKQIVLGLSALIRQSFTPGSPLLPYFRQMLKCLALTAQKARVLAADLAKNEAMDDDDDVHSDPEVELIEVPTKRSTKVDPKQNHPLNNNSSTSSSSTTTTTSMIDDEEETDLVSTAQYCDDLEELDNTIEKKVYAIEQDMDVDPAGSSNEENAFDNVEELEIARAALQTIPPIQLDAHLLGLETEIQQVLRQLRDTGEVPT